MSNGRSLRLLKSFLNPVPFSQQAAEGSIAALEVPRRNPGCSRSFHNFNGIVQADRVGTAFGFNISLAKFVADAAEWYP